MKKPRPYQSECIEMLDLARKIEMDKALIVMASGLGKTLTSAFDIANYLNESEERKRILFLCHNNEILDGAKREYKSIFGDEFSYGLFTGIEKTAHKVDFLFASFQTMKHWLKTFDKHEFDYIVVDEAHHAQARSYKRVIKYFKPKFLLGMTATPKRLDGLDLSELFGETVYEKDLPAAIRDGLLSDVDYRLLLDDIEKIFEYLDRDDVTIAELNRNVFIPKRDEEIVRIINEKLAERENPKTLVFCPSINYANIMAEMLDGAVVVHSEIPQQECLQRISDFRHGKVPKFEENRGDYYTDEQLAKDFRNKTISLGRIPTRREIEDDPNMASSRTYGAHFGPTKNIIKAAGVENYWKRYKAPELKFTKEELLDGLCEFYRKNSRWPLTKEMNSKNGLHACDTYVKYFGSFSAAIEAAKQHLGNKEE